MTEPEELSHDDYDCDVYAEVDDVEVDVDLVGSVEPEPYNPAAWLAA